MTLLESCFYRPEVAGFLWAGFFEALVLHPERSVTACQSDVDYPSTDGTKVANYRKGKVLHYGGNCP